MLLVLWQGFTENVFRPSENKYCFSRVSNHGSSWGRQKTVKDRRRTLGARRQLFYVLFLHVRDPQIDVGAGRPFCTENSVGFLSNWDCGEIDFTNHRLKLKIKNNPTSWD